MWRMGQLPLRGRTHSRRAAQAHRDLPHLHPPHPGAATAMIPRDAFPGSPSGSLRGSAPHNGAAASARLQVNRARPPSTTNAPHHPSRAGAPALATAARQARRVACSGRASHLIAARGRRDSRRLPPPRAPARPRLPGTAWPARFARRPDLCARATRAQRPRRAASHDPHRTMPTTPPANRGARAPRRAPPACLSRAPTTKPR